MQCVVLTGIPAASTVLGQQWGDLSTNSSDEDVGGSQLKPSAMLTTQPQCSVPGQRVLDPGRLVPIVGVLDSDVCSFSR